MKAFVIFCLLSVVLSGAFAQTAGTVYYLKNSGKLVAAKDSADYSMVVLPPDTAIDKNLYVIYEYYPNGKVKLVTNSKEKDINLLYQGRYVAYYINGKKKATGSFNKGKPAGSEIDYFPNGKLYNTKEYAPDSDKVKYLECRDSTGKVLAENGKGDWMEYDSDFKQIVKRGKIDNGYRVDLWHFITSDSTKSDFVYNKGIVQSTRFYRKAKDNTYVSIDTFPQFPGRPEAFGQFLGKNLRYPREAREAGVQGRVIVGFSVEKDGSLTDIHLVKGIEKNLDDEALRIMKISPRWKPAYAQGNPVKYDFTMPITFSL